MISPWSEIPERHGPSTTCYNRFVRWRKAGVWDRLLAAVSAAFKGEVVMIDSTLRSRPPARCDG
jgi:transposase